MPCMNSCASTQSYSSEAVVLTQPTKRLIAGSIQPGDLVIVLWVFVGMPTTWCCTSTGTGCTMGSRML